MIILATASTRTPFADDLIARWATRTDGFHAAARGTPRGRFLTLLARAAMRDLLFRETGQTEWNFEADSRGKLSIADRSGRAGPAICTAHTRGMVACGLGDVASLGVDVEAHRRRDFAALAGWSFGPRERAAVAAGEGAAFYRIWTVREAMGKATGAGLTLATDGRDRVADTPVEGTWPARIDRQDWLLGHFVGPGDVSTAFAAMPRAGDRPESLTVRHVTLDAPGRESVAVTRPLTTIGGTCRVQRARLS